MLAQFSRDAESIGRFAAFEEHVVRGLVQDLLQEAEKAFVHLADQCVRVVTVQHENVDRRGVVGHTDRAVRRSVLLVVIGQVRTQAARQKAEGDRRDDRVGSALEGRVRQEADEEHALDQEENADHEDDEADRKEDEESNDEADEPEHVQLERVHLDGGVGARQQVPGLQFFGGEPLGDFIVHDCLYA